MTGVDVSYIAGLVLAKLPVIVGALAVFIIGRIFAGKFSAGFERLLSKNKNFDRSLARFLASIIKYSILFFAIMASLGILGVDIRAFGAVILGAGAAMAFILKDTLSDFAAGVMLMIFKPYKIGDEVEIHGIKGVVTDIGIVATRMKTRGNIERIVANSKAWGGVIKNHNALGVRRLDKVFSISYNDNIDEAINVLKQTAMSDMRVLSQPAVWAKVVNLGDSSVDIELRFWTKYDDHRKIKMDISKMVKQAFDEAGINIPYPTEIKIKQKVKHSKARKRLEKMSKLKS